MWGDHVVVVVVVVAAAAAVVVAVVLVLLLFFLLCMAFASMDHTTDLALSTWEILSPTARCQGLGGLVGGWMFSSIPLAPKNMLLRVIHLR